jgi:predicted nucleic acid-binding protein
MAGSFVLDNSVAMSWCFEDECSEYADKVLERLQTEDAIVPAIWPLEVANVLVAAERRKRLTAADSTRFVKLLQDLPIVVAEQEPDRTLADVLALARASRLSSYDASYLDLAMTSGLPLATLDTNLQKAARKAIVELV